MGSNPVQALFPYCSSSVHYCEDRFHIYEIITVCLIIYSLSAQIATFRVHPASLFQGVRKVALVPNYSPYQDSCSYCITHNITQALVRKETLLFVLCCLNCLKE